MPRTTHYAALPLLLCTATLQAQVPMDAIGSTITIDFTNTVSGVNNGAFTAGTPIGDQAPAGGQLDYDAWNYFTDGSPTNAAQGAANFPGAIPNGNGVGTAGALTGGISAVDINGDRALAVQPTGTVWTSGNLTLRAVNNTGAPLQQMEVSFDVFIYNDQPRANDVRFLYSLTAAANSWTEATAVAVLSPEAADASPAWVQNSMSTTLGGFSLNPGDIIYFRWVGNDVTGAGSRDEFALDNIAITPQAATGPVIQSSTVQLFPMGQDLGAPGVPQSLVVEGANLADALTATATAPFEVSLSEQSGYAGSVVLPQSGGVVAQTTLWVRLFSPSAGTFNGTLTLTSPGAATVVVSLSGTTLPGTSPDMHINEVQSANSATSTITDENGEHDDWFELYNPTSGTVDLGGWYVTNDPADLVKYQFPQGSPLVVVPAGGFLLVWADDQVFQGDLHASFTLDEAGDELLLVGPDGTTVVAELTIGPQAADVSFGSVTDGSLTYAPFTSPTPGTSNGTVGMSDAGGEPGLRAWPNPATGGMLLLSAPVNGVLLAADGRLLARLSRTSTIDLSGLPGGSYVLRTDMGRVLRFVR